MELIELVKQAQTGDAEAQGALYEKTYKRAYYLALRLTGNPEDAQDAAQDAFISAFTALPNLREPSAFEGWLFQIVANKCRNRMTRGHNDEELPEGFEEHEPDPQEDLIPEDALQSAEKRRLILQMIDDLPEAQRECVMLFYYSEMSVKQIAETLECSEGTVKSRLNYARQKLKDGILETEKRDNIRLHTFIPFGLFLAKDFVLSMAGVTTAAVGSTAAVAASTGGAAAGTSTAGTAAGTVKAGLLATAKAKVIAGVTAAAIVVGGGTAVVSQMPKAIAFSDPAMEQNIRVLVDKPEGTLYADDVDELYFIYLFDDGMALDDDSGYAVTAPQGGTVRVESLADLAQIPHLQTLFYCGTASAILDTIPEGLPLRSFFSFGQEDAAFDLSNLAFLDKLPNLTQFYANVSPGTDLAPVERRTTLRDLELESTGSLRLQADELQALTLLTLHSNWGGQPNGSVGELILTRDLPELRELWMSGLVPPALDFLEHTPELLVLHLYCNNTGALNLTSMGGLQKLRAFMVVGNPGQSLDLTPLSGCSSLAVCAILVSQISNPPAHVTVETDGSHLFNQILQEVGAEINNLRSDGKW